VRTGGVYRCGGPSRANIHTNSREEIPEKRSARSVELYQSLSRRAKRTRACRKNKGLRSSGAKGKVGVSNMRSLVWSGIGLARLGRLDGSCVSR